MAFKLGPYGWGSKPDVQWEEDYMCENSEARKKSIVCLRTCKAASGKGAEWGERKVVHDETASFFHAEC